ncbi:hypothetical protein SDC9_102921 [bioreactor metagenome]|uniref:Uncharacterized protein n=1 Tax=bioreactor metagenome TaxID=1076179 RepID=A0A645AS72_9ZZZZ
MAIGTTSAADAPDVPSTTVPLPPRRMACISSRALSRCASMRRAWAISAAPCTVGRKPRAWRSNSGRPMSPSSSLSHLESAGCEVPSICADWLMLPVAARLFSMTRLRSRRRKVQSISRSLASSGHSDISKNI